MTRRGGLVFAVIALVLLLTSAPVARAATLPSDEGHEILEGAGIRAGLIVHLGCGAVASRPPGAHDAFVFAGPPRFDEEQTTQYLATSRTDRLPLDPLPQEALDTFEGRKGGILCAVDKSDGRELTQLELPSPPVFDGMIAAGGKLLLSLKDGSVVCLGSR